MVVCEVFVQSLVVVVVARIGARRSIASESATSVAYIPSNDPFRKVGVKCSVLDRIVSAILSDVTEGMKACLHASAISISLSSSHMHADLVESLSPDPRNFSAR